MLVCLFLRYFEINDNFNGIFKTTYIENFTRVEASGSGLCYDKNLRKDIRTKPENCVDPESKLDWCSDMDFERKRMPWLLISLKEKFVKISGYSMKLGCCEYGYCCCRIHSWKLEGSNDNKTWSLLHEGVRDKDYKDCDQKTFQTKEGTYSMFRLSQTEPWPDCPSCIFINKIELFGELLESEYSRPSIVDNDEEVSIIGKVHKE